MPVWSLYNNCQEAGPCMQSVKHIVLLSPGFARDETDTTCLTFLQDYALALKRLEPALQFEILSLQYPFDRGEYRWNDIPVFSAQGKNSKYLRRLPTWWKMFRKLRALKPKRVTNAMGGGTCHSVRAVKCIIATLVAS